MKIHFTIPKINPTEYEFVIKTQYYGIDFSTRLLYTKTDNDELPSRLIVQLFGFGFILSWSDPYEELL